MSPSSPASTTASEPQVREVEVALIRHGESIWNAEGRYQGQQGPGLSELGHEQARMAAAYVIDRFGTFDRAVASDLPRVQETRQPWSDKTGTTPTIDQRFREIDSGDWAGRFPDEVKKLYPEELAAMRRREDIPRGGGETFAQLRARVWEAMTHWVTQPVPDSREDGRPISGDRLRIIVFTHGGCIQTSAAEALGLPPMGHTWLRPPTNCSLTLFRHQVDAAGQLIDTELVEYATETGMINS